MSESQSVKINFRVEGIGQPPFQSPPFKLQSCVTGGIKEGAGA